MRCLRCKRPLKAPESVERGYGPTCYKKFLKENQQTLEVFM